LNFENNNRGSEFRPKYFGTYEDELDSFFLKFKGSTLIDIGSDDGYYSIGLLKNLYVNNVFAFEINDTSISNFKKNLKLNSIGVQEIKLAERFVNDFESIKDCFNTSDKFLIKCDIEGGEYQLFNDEMIKSISKYNTSLIIETHLNEELESALISRFLENKFKVEIKEKLISKRWRGDIGVINNFLLRLFGKYWLNEHRPLFNRWIVVSNN
jgi:ribosomal protein L11 methylase PrmA